MKYSLLTSLLFLACGQQVPPGPPVPVGPEPVPVVTSATCSTACDRQRRLNCELGRSTPLGATCEEVCDASFETGIDQMRWDVVDLTNAKRCEE